jgi:hypothetical protein
MGVNFQPRAIKAKPAQHIADFITECRSRSAIGGGPSPDPIGKLLIFTEHRQCFSVYLTLAFTPVGNLRYKVADQSYRRSDASCGESYPGRRIQTKSPPRRRNLCCRTVRISYPEPISAEERDTTSRTLGALPAGQWSPRIRLALANDAVVAWDGTHLCRLYSSMRTVAMISSFSPARGSEMIR